MHLKRIIAAVIFIPLFLLLVLKGTYAQYSILVFILALLGLIEYFRLIGETVDRKIKTIGIAWGVGLTCAFYAGDSRVVISVLTFGFMALCIMRLTRAQDLSTVIQEIGHTSSGAIYVGALFGHLLLIRALHQGEKWTMLLFFTIWMCDIAAFYTGLSIGKNKLAPSISPNKTIEGAIGGMAGCLAVALAAKVWYLRQLTFPDVVAISFGIAVMGQLGDLCESMFKRAAGVKDSGNLIPGHGGILDRFDSTLFAAPFLYYYLIFIKGVNETALRFNLPSFGIF